MTGQLALATLGAIGVFTTVLVSVFQFFNTRKGVKGKSDADAYESYRSFTSGATADRDNELGRLKAERTVLWGIRTALTDLVQELLVALRKRGAGPDDLDDYQDRLDTIRVL